MDIQTGLLCLGVAIISAVVIYIISMPTMKEKTYDEMLADVRKRAEKQSSQGRSAKEKIKDKKDKKKAGKKVKEKSVSNGNEGFELSDVDGSNKNHVVFVEPEAAVLSENIVVEEKKRTKKKEKPILLNKNEPKAVAEKPVPIQNHFEQIHPKDDFELKRSHSREEMIKTTSTNTETAIPAGIPVKEQNTQKHNKQSSKTAGGSNVSNKAVAEQKVEKQQPLQVKQNQPKQPKQSEKSNPAKAEKNTTSNSNKGVIGNQVTPSVVNSAGSEVKEVILTKQTFNKPQAVPAKQSMVTPENISPTPLMSQQHSQNNERPAASPTVKISKKKKSELATLNQISGGSDGVNVNLLMPLVRKAELSKSEIQLLIDFLLNKQQGISDSSSEWIEGRQDPVVKLKKQLAEKEKALADELEASVGFQARLKEIRAELNAEKHTVRTLEEAIHARQTEISSFALKLQHAVDEKQALAQQIQQLQTKMGEEHHLVRKLQEESAQAQNAYQELLAQRQQLDMHIQHVNDSQHQQQETIAALEAQLTSQVQERDALAGEFSILQERTSHLQDNAIQVQELARQVEELRSVRANLEHLVTSANFENGRLQTEVNELSEQLNIVRAENEKVNAALLSVQNENSRLREANERLNIQVSSACVEARQLRDENESLAAQVTASMERPATEGRENGDVNNYSENKLSHIEDQDNIQKKELLLEDMSNQLKSKEILVENLTSELNSYKTEIVEQQRTVQSLKDEVSKHQQEAERLSNDLTQQKSQISRLIEQLDSQQSKNNDLRTKNWKVMEALSSTEKLLQSKMNESDKLVNEAVKSAVEKVLLEQQSSTRQLLQRVFPELVVPDCKGHQEWFEQVEKALKNWKPQQTDNNQSSCFVELEKQNNQLQAMVNHYKNIINDTEAMLNKLQKHVEQEESKWGEELQALKSQLEAVTRERDELQASSGSIQRATNGFNHVGDGCGND